MPHLMVVTGLEDEGSPEQGPAECLGSSGGPKASQGSFIKGGRKVIVTERGMRTEAQVKCYGHCHRGLEVPRC